MNNENKKIAGTEKSSPEEKLKDLDLGTELPNTHQKSAIVAAAEEEE